MTTLITSAAFKPIVAFAFKPTVPFFWFSTDAFYGRIFWEQTESCNSWKCRNHFLLPPHSLWRDEEHHVHNIDNQDQWREPNPSDQSLSQHFLRGPQNWWGHLFFFQKRNSFKDAQFWYRSAFLFGLNMLYIRFLLFKRKILLVTALINQNKCMAFWLPVLTQPYFCSIFVSLLIALKTTKSEQFDIVKWT